jgi:tetratricopeptide (TPR) repeat protein
LCQQGRAAEALEEARRQLQEDPDNPWYLSLSALALAQLERVDESLEIINTAVAADPESEAVLLVRAMVFYCVDLDKQALAAVDDALQVDPEFYEALALKAELLATAGKNGRALEAATAAMRIDPEEAWARKTYALVARNLGRWEEAREEVERLLSEDPEDDELHAQRGWLALETGDIDGAMASFQESLRLDPRENETALSGLFQCLMARHPIYRPYLRYELFLSRHPWIVRIALAGLAAGALAVVALVVTLFLVPEDAPVAVMFALHLAFMVALAAIYLGSLGAPAFNVLLLLDRVARRTMRLSEKAAGILFSFSLGLAVFFFLANQAIGQALGGWLVFFSGLTLASPFLSAVSLKKRWTTCVAGALAVLAALLFLAAGVVTLLPGENPEVRGGILAAFAILVVLKGGWVQLILRIVDR